SKLNGDVERAIERDVHEGGQVPENGSLAVTVKPQFHAAYLDSLKERFAGLELFGIRLVIDCANGAASELAPELFASFGAEVTALHCSPNGRNINRDCGSLHLEGLQQSV